MRLRLGMVLLAALLCAGTVLLVRRGAGGTQGLSSSEREAAPAGGGAARMADEALARALASAVAIRVRQDEGSAGPRKNCLTAPVEDARRSEAVVIHEELWGKTRFPLSRGGLEGYGAGVVVARRLVMTSARLVQQVRDVEVVPWSGRPVIGRVVVEDARTGLAIVRTDGPVGEPAAVSSEEVRVTEPVIVVGTPRRLPHTVTWCRVSHGRRGILEVPDQVALQLDGISPGGYEGAPAFSTAGELVGIVLQWPVRMAFSERLAADSLSTAAWEVSHPTDVAFLVPVKRLIQRLVDSARDTEARAPPEGQTAQVPNPPL